jgi:phosphopantothenoylcysteine decarboxylase / phosphopantothenate---cysteine ligase
MRSDRRFLVTAGATIERLDPVRYITNFSSGKMGIAIADAAHAAGFPVELICGNVCSALLDGKQYPMHRVESTRDLHDAVLERLGNRCTLVMAAAPADYRPAVMAESKIKKSDDRMVIELVRNPDILSAASLKRMECGLSGCLLAGFAAETGDTESYALNKLETKNIDIIFANTVGAAANPVFGSDRNDITAYTRSGGVLALGSDTKNALAAQIIGILQELAGE